VSGTNGKRDDRPLWLFVDDHDIATARANGLRAEDFWTILSPVGLDVRIVAPKRHLYADEHAPDVAARTFEAGAAVVRIIRPPFHRSDNLKTWLEAFTLDDLEAIALNSPEWHPATGGVVGARPEIVIGPDEMRVNDAVVNAMARDPDLYQLGGSLVTIIDGGPSPRGVEYRDAPPPQIRPIGLATLRERIAARVRFVKERTKGDVVELVPVHPPDWCVSAVLHRGVYPGVRPIEGVIEAPTMRPDGSILSQPGYDPATGLFYRPNAAYESIPLNPTRADAEAARDALLDLTTNFPWRDRAADRAADRAVWLAALLTVVGRAAFEGPAPLFGFDANCPGSGKTLLADLIATIAHGGPIARTTLPTGRGADDEIRKRITSIALAGERLTLIDNISEPLGGAALDAALTATTWRDRVLGESRMTAPLPLKTVWLASGNNLACRGDVLRRVLFARLQSEVENPEERDGFKYPHLIEHVRTNRARLVVAALTILRAHHVAGRPNPLKPLGSFEDWTRVIASAVAWCGAGNPLDVRKTTKADDPEANLRIGLVAGWAELPGSESGVTAAEALKLLKAPGAEDQFAVLRAALMEISRTSDMPSAYAIGKRLREVKDRVVGGLVLRHGTNRIGTGVWRVERAAPPAPSPKRPDDKPHAGDAGDEKAVQEMESGNLLHGNHNTRNGLRANAGDAGDGLHSTRGKTTESGNFAPGGLQTSPASPASPAASGASSTEPKPEAAVLLDRYERDDPDKPF